MRRKNKPEFITETCNCDKCKKLIFERKTVERENNNLFFSEKRARKKELSANPLTVRFITVRDLNYNIYATEKHFCIDCGIKYINESLTKNTKAYTFEDEYTNGYDIRQTRIRCCKSDLID